MASILARIFNLNLLPKRCLTINKTLMQEMPDPLQLVTGLQKKEIKAFIEGNCDPFHIKVLKRGSGTKEDPTLIPSAFSGRIVGCICNDNRFVNYMWLEKDCPKRCECGHWFKIKTVEGLSRGF